MVGNGVYVSPFGEHIHSFSRSAWFLSVVSCSITPAGHIGQCQLHLFAPVWYRSSAVGPSVAKVECNFEVHVMWYYPCFHGVVSYARSCVGVVVSVEVGIEVGIEVSALCNGGMIWCHGCCK